MRFYKLPDSLDQEIRDYADWVQAYLRGAVETRDHKSITAPMGVYEQRDDGKFMLRIRLPGGSITPAQLLWVAAIAEKYSPAPLHLTTRQDIQIHHLRLADTVEVIRQLQEVGLSSRGGGGNTLRNIICAYDSGVDPEEAFNVYPYVYALTTRMIAESDSWSLPRKFKIAFSGSAADKGLATVNDLGFVARKNEAGAAGFAVYIGGGLGTKPKTGFRLYEFIAATEVYNITKAAKIFFDRYGDRQNRHWARLRFVLDRLGKAEFIAAFEAVLQEVRKANYPQLQVEPLPEPHKGFLTIPVLFGDFPVEQAKLLGAIMQNYGEDTIRLTPDQNLFLRNIPLHLVPGLKETLVKGGIIQPLPPVLERATVCTGARTCKLGICDSKGLAAAIREHLEAVGVDSQQLKGLTIKISGCPNTCGQHLLADIGFYGVMKRIGQQTVAYYHLVVGGNVTEENVRLAQNAALLPAQNVPRFLKEFLDFVAVQRADHETFVAFLERVGLAKIKELERKYCNNSD